MGITAASAGLDERFSDECESHLADMTGDEIWLSESKL
jgi:hypothetical protein